MKTRDVVSLLTHRRHEWMNTIQLLQGYMSMKNESRVREIIDDITAELNEERYLFNLNAPDFALWLIQFNHQNANIRITYDIRTAEMDLGKIDEALTEQCRSFFREVRAFMHSEEMYEGILTVEKDDSSRSVLSLQLTGEFMPFDGPVLTEHLRSHETEMHIENTSEGIIWQLKYPFLK